MKKRRNDRDGDDRGVKVEREEGWGITMKYTLNCTHYEQVEAEVSWLSGEESIDFNS